MRLCLMTVSYPWCINIFWSLNSVRVSWTHLSSRDKIWETRRSQGKLFAQDVGNDIDTRNFLFAALSLWKHFSPENTLFLMDQLGTNPSTLLSTFSYGRGSKWSVMFLKLRQWRWSSFPKGGGKMHFEKAKKFFHKSCILSMSFFRPFEHAHFFSQSNYWADERHVGRQQISIISVSSVKNFWITLCNPIYLPNSRLSKFGNSSFSTLTYSIWLTLHSQIVITLFLTVH